MIRGARHVPRKQWDALVRRGIHRHAWFVTAEACGAEPKHAGVYRGGKLVAVVPAYIEREARHGDFHSRWYGPAHRVAAALGASLRPSIVIGAPMSTSSDPLGPENVLTGTVLDEAMDLLEAEARDAGAKAIVWPFVDASAGTIREIARARGYRESFARAEAVIDVEWKSPEQYLASRSRNVQRTLRNELAWVHDQGIRISWESDLQPHAEMFDALYRASYVSRTGHAATLASDFFGELAKQRSPDVRVQCAWRGTTLLQMAVALEGNGSLDLCMSAQSDETNRGLLHQHCLCFDPIRAAIEGGLTLIHLGPGELYAKLLRGARLNTKVSLVRGLSPVASAAVRVLAPIANARNLAKHRRLVGRITAENEAP